MLKGREESRRVCERGGGEVEGKVSYSVSGDLQFT